MKRIILITFGLLSMLISEAQTDSITVGAKFLYDLPLENILAKAKSEGKLVFVDCYTDWCAVCKRMDKQEFSKKEAGDYFNANFVNVKYNMEKGEGSKHVKEWDVSAYPTYIVFDTNCKLLYRWAGGQPIDTFIKRIKEGIKNHKLADMKQQFEGGDRSIQFINEYITELNKAYMKAEVDKVTRTFLAGRETEVLSDTSVCRFFMNNCAMISPNDSLFQKIYASRKICSFDNNTIKTDFNRFLMSVWVARPFKERWFDAKSRILTDSVAQYTDFIKSQNLDYKKEILAQEELFCHLYVDKKDVKTIYKLLNRTSKDLYVNVNTIVVACQYLLKSDELNEKEKNKIVEIVQNIYTQIENGLTDSHSQMSYCTSVFKNILRKRVISFS
jgi:thioredoxin-related protein